MKSLFIIITTFYFLGCVKTNQNNHLVFVNSGAADQDKLLQFYDSLLISNNIFKRLVDQLLNEGKVISVQFSKEVVLGGMQFPRNNEIHLVFSSVDEFMDENMIIEEFFHAYQFQFYGESRFKKNKNGKIAGASNIEFEAKLFKAILWANQGKPFKETPSQKGMVSFVLSLLDEKGELSVFKLKKEQHDEYIKLVKHFQEHWRLRNSREKKRNFYDHPVDETLSPDACFYLLQK